MNLLLVCKKCGATDRNSSGNCRVCQKALALVINARRKGVSRSLSVAVEGRRKRLTKQESLEKQRQRVIDWTAKNPEKSAAHIEVFKALSSKKLIRLPCLVCGEKAECHHPDYNRPLDVMWLCRTHHKQTHALAL